MSDILSSPQLTLERFIEFNLALSRERDHQKQINTIATAARYFTSALGCCVYLLDRTKRKLIPEHVQGELLEARMSSLPTIELYRQERHNMEDICSYSALTGQLVNISDIYRYSGFNFNDWIEQDAQFQQRSVSMLAAPLSDNEGTSVGVLLLVNCQESNEQPIGPFPDEIEHLVKAFAAQVAITVHSVRLLKENKQLLQQTKELNEQLTIENESLKILVSQSLNLDKVIGDSPAMKNIYALIEKVSKSNATVLLRGETGTGKELIAEAIHQNSPVSNGVFIAQNCAALPADLLESEMFGYKKGAFTGANSNKKGLFEMANSGTLFLDEIGDMPLSLQSKLLRVLQEGYIRPLGSTEEIKVTPRVIAATHSPLESLIKDGKFREDLFYRLNVFPIVLPAVRERKEDIPALVSYFISKYAEQHGKQVDGLMPNVLNALSEYEFPGNVRQLQNIIERAVLLADDQSPLRIEHLPIEFQELGLQRQAEQVQDTSLQDNDLKTIVARYEAKVIAQHIKHNNGNQTLTAKQLGVSRRTLVDKITKYDLR